MRVGSYFLGSSGESAARDVDLNTATSMLLKTLSTLRATPLVALISSTGIPAQRLEEAIALLKSGDRVRIDLKKGRADILLSDAELAERRAALQKQGGFPYPPHQTPWQEIQRGMVDQLAEGMVLKPAVKYQRVAEKFVPRDNH